MSEAFQIIGRPQKHPVLIVADHASNHVPQDIDLGISPQYLEDHIAYDIGIAEIARIVAENTGYMAMLGTVSRLIVDLNRYPDEEAVIPLRSDGVEVPGNVMDEMGKEFRLDRFFHPYHNRLADLISELEPSLVLSLHSFTPRLRASQNAPRHWDIGVLYNEYEAASRFAIQYLEEEGLVVGDQVPFSGKELNATMNRQAEAVGQPYFGVEIRQDHIEAQKGQRRFADLLMKICEKIREGLA